MSRHEVEAKSPRYQIAVGWDNPLNTYFAQVEDIETEIEEEAILVWVGTDDNEVQTPEALQEAIKEYGTLSAEMIAQLRADRAAMLDKAPTPLQRMRVNR